MFIALDKLANQKLKQAIIVVPEKTIGASFHDEPLSQFGFWADWKVEPRWNLCNAPGGDNGGKVDAVRKFLDGADKGCDKILVCTHATFRFAVEKFGVEAFDDRLIAVDEFHHVSAVRTAGSGSFTTTAPKATCSPGHSSAPCIKTMPAAVSSSRARDRFFPTLRRRAT
jgi:hypothetical protein